jgi:hypothetical protein
MLKSSKIRYGYFGIVVQIRTGFEDKPASYPGGSGGSFPGVKWLKCEGDYSTQSSVEVLDLKSAELK